MVDFPNKTSIFLLRISELAMLRKTPEGRIVQVERDHAGKLSTLRCLGTLGSCDHDEPFNILETLPLNM